MFNFGFGAISDASADVLSNPAGDLTSTDGFNANGDPGAMSNREVCRDGREACGLIEGENFSGESERARSK